MDDLSATENARDIALRAAGDFQALASRLRAVLRLALESQPEYGLPRNHWPDWMVEAQGLLDDGIDYKRD